MRWLQQTSALAVLSAALALTYTIEEHRLHTERARSAELALHASNAAAQRDSTRNLALANRKVAALLGDSLHAVERTVVQIAGRRDAMDRALGRERIARYLMDVIVDSLHTASTTAPIAEGADRVRHARFDLRQAPYTVAAHVEMPAVPDSVRLSLTVALDPIHLTARLGCAAPDAQGIRSASIVASSPPWAKVRFDSVEQSPAVCSTAGVVRRDRWRTTPVAGAGWVVGPDGHLRWGLFLGLGIGRA